MQPGWFRAWLVWLGLAGSAHAFTLLSWNVSGNGAPDWSTNAAQVQAIGRVLSWLRPDVITLQEIPFDQTHQMPQWVRAWLPGYALATNSGTDGYLRSVVVSRFPVRRSASWLDGAALRDWGYEGSFTRDLFEVELAVPGFPTPVHVFTTHLKQGSTESDLRRRAAEAAAISNWLVTVFLPGHADRPHVLTGDLNEDVLAPPAGSRQPVAKLVNPATGLRLLTPRAAGSNSEKTWSTRPPGLLYRFDYVLPGGLLFSNVVRAEVVHTATLQPLPPGVNRDDEIVASDHLALWVEFANPYARPFRLTRVARAAERYIVEWEAAAGFAYDLETSTDLRDWRVVVAGLTNAAGLSWEGPALEPTAFFRVRRVP